jgi:DNA-binding MarR family transcriptional regulator
MSQEPFEDIETKVLDFLRKAGAPNVASQIAIYIHENREDTLQAIERLVKKGLIKHESDFTFLNSTRETIAFSLA